MWPAVLPTGSRGAGDRLALLDSTGRVRFQSWSLDDALRQVWLLQRRRAG